MARVKDSASSAPNSDLNSKFVTPLVQSLYQAYTIRFPLFYLRAPRLKTLIPIFHFFLLQPY